MNGLLVVDKPAGMTSHDVVDMVRRATGERSIGHLGTLDPMATGVLPLLLGKFTRLAQFFNAAEKAYEGVIRFGWATDTFDAEGERVGEAQALQLGLDELRELREAFHGEMDQVPPVFSAKKIGGVPAHKLARAGKPVEVKAARILIRRFELLGLEGDRARFEIEVSAGGYVRSVAHELGQMAGCGAHLAELRRAGRACSRWRGRSTVEELKATGGEGRRDRAAAGASANAAARDAVGDGGRAGCGEAAERDAGESAGVLAGGDGEGVYGADGDDGDCEAGGGDADAAGGRVSGKRRSPRGRGARVLRPAL